MTAPPMNCWYWIHRQTQVVTSRKCLQSQPPYKGKLFITRIEECGGKQDWYQVPSLRFTSLNPNRFFIQTALEIQGDCRKGLREHTWTLPTTDSRDSI
jgi:hypothetical protein